MPTNSTDDPLREELERLPISKFQDGSPMYLEDAFSTEEVLEFLDGLEALLKARIKEAEDRTRISEARWFKRKVHNRKDLQIDDNTNKAYFVDNEITKLISDHIDELF